jgi:hypothetical protein
MHISKISQSREFGFWKEWMTSGWDFEPLQNSIDTTSVLIFGKRKNHKPFDDGFHVSYLWF